MKQLLTLFFSMIFVMSYAQLPVLKGDNWELYLNENGTIDQLVLTGEEIKDTVQFTKKKKYQGPSFYMASHRSDAFKGVILDDRVAEWQSEGPLAYKAMLDDLECQLEYKNIDGNLSIEVSIKNVGKTIYQPLKAGLKMGIDTYMDKYPNWLDIYFPTLLRSEKDHFWGYLMTPKQNILLLTSPNPIASWSADYNYMFNEKENKPSFWGLHRIYGINLDLINAHPLPARHPQKLYQLHPGEEKTWKIQLSGLESLTKLEEKVSTLNQAPIFDLPRTGFEENEMINFSVISNEKPNVYFNDNLVESVNNGDNRYSVELSAGIPGHYRLIAKASGRTTEATVTVHHPWKWYLNHARDEALRVKQKATTHIESWYGFIPAFGAAKYMPNIAIDQQHIDRFEHLYNLLHKDNVPQVLKARIQNTSGTIDILNAKFKAFGDIKDIERAAELADWLIDFSQTSDGAFRTFHGYEGKPENEEDGILYTSVLYMAKSMLDLALTEKELAETDRKWKKRYRTHFQSAQRAIDQLVSLDGDLETEGEMTFEDGMISCTALQIAYLGLQDEIDEKDVNTYKEAALKLLKSHDCLAQIKVPDGRQRGGTMRFWESQYDVMMIPNFMNTPHGWSAWRGYATYYTYLLTGDEHWLIETFNAASSFVQLIDYETGKLRWSFCANPFVPVRMSKEPHPTANVDSVNVFHLNAMHYKGNQFVIGEEYIDMVSNWQPHNTQDNDVFEVFKFMEEAVLTNAFVIERETGEFIGYNCSVENGGGVLKVKPNDVLIEQVHCNLKSTNKVMVVFADKLTTRDVRKDDLTWIKKTL